METKRTKLDELKGRNPFKTPESYMEELAEQIMSQLPEKPREEAKTISLFERIRPWLYMAAVFVGLIFLFKLFDRPRVMEENRLHDKSLFVQAGSSAVRAVALSDEDRDYLEYLENNYYNDAFTEAIENVE
jgi:hypothetical protein